MPGSEISLAGVGLNPTRTGLLAILRRMGAEIEVEPEGERGGEPIGHIRARPSPLHGVEVGGAEVPLAIDELPLVALAACFAEGTTTIRDAAELRRKESDRIATVSEALSALGGSVEATEDGMAIEGSGGLRGGTVHSHGDHRIAMLGAVAGLASREGVEVEGMDAAAVSYPVDRLRRAEPRLAAAMVIAIDGPAGAGKSSVARGVAAALGFTYLDSGAMYRCVALAGIERGGDLDDAEAMTEIALGLEIAFDGDRVLSSTVATSSTAIREPEVTEASSRVSVHPGVREAMVARQRELIAAGRYVAEGRDIGTVVSPDSPLKVFLTASDEERARRRAAQTGEDPGAVLAAQRERDRRDETREHSALRAADDAVEIDTTGLSLDDVVDRVVAPRPRARAAR